MARRPDLQKYLHTKPVLGIVSEDGGTLGLNRTSPRDWPRREVAPVATNPFEDTELAFSASCAVGRSLRSPIYWVRVSFTEIHGRVEPVSVDIRAYPRVRDPKPMPGGVYRSGIGEATPIPATALRRIPLNDIVAAARETYYVHTKAAASFREDLRPALAERLPAARSSVNTPRLGRPPLTAEKLEEVVAAYTLAVQRGNPTPRKAVFETVADCPSINAAGKRIQKARKLGLLPKTDRGIPKATMPKKSPKRKGKRNAKEQ